MQVTRTNAVRWFTGALVISLAVVGMIIFVLSRASAPTPAAELQQFDIRFAEVKPDLDRLIDLFEPAMHARNTAELHELENKANALLAKWQKQTYSAKAVVELHTEVSLALVKVGGAYGLGYVYGLRPAGADTEAKAIASAAEGVNHVAAMYQKRAALIGGARN